jgi:hypothetical protein
MRQILLMTNQGALQQSVRNITGTSLDYNGDLLSLIVANGIAITDFNGSLKRWIDSAILGETHYGIDGSMQALAVAHSRYNWSSMDTIAVPGGPITADLASLTADNNVLTADGAFFTADVGALTADSSRYTVDRA